MGGWLWSLGHTYFSYMSTGSALDVMNYGSAKAESSTQDYLLVLRLYDLYLQVILITAEQYTFCFFLSMEKTPSLISPYMCYGLCALRYGWSAAVPWSRLFFLHVHGLRARRHGLWAS